MSLSSRVVGPAKTMAGLTLASRVLGLVRDAAFAGFLGAGAVSSAFVVAFQIPNLLRRLFGEGALSAAFVPVFSDYHHGGDAPGARQMAASVLGLLVCVLVALTILGEAAVGLIWLLQGSDERTGLTLVLTAIMLPFMVMICSTATLGGLLNVLGHFAIPAVAPVVLNLCMIAALVGGAAWLGAGSIDLAYLLAGAVLFAGVLQVLLHFVMIRRRGFKLSLSLNVHHPGVRRVVRTMGPMVVGLGAVQVNTLADTMIAYWFVDYAGAPTVLYYAHRLYDFPLGVFGIALVTAAFAELSRLASINDWVRFRETVVKSLQLVLFVGVPASIGLILVRQPLIALLFERGEFDPAATRRVAFTLLFYAAGVWAFGCQHVFIRGLYALKDPRTPMRVAACMILLNVPLNLLLVGPMAEGGLALSTTICAVVQLVWLGSVLLRRVGPIAWLPLAWSVGRTVIASLAMAALVLAIDVAGVRQASDVLRVVVLVATGILAYGLAAWVVRHEQLHEWLRRR